MYSAGASEVATGRLLPKNHDNLIYREEEREMIPQWFRRPGWRCPGCSTGRA